MLIRLVALTALVLAGVPAVTATDDFPPLFPFVISYDGPENASSMAHLLSAPAGKHGFVRSENGRFVDDAGPVRLHATNLTGPANFPSHRDADRLAARLARFGINCVRLHFMDTLYGSFMDRSRQGILTEEPTTQRNFDPAQVERLDYMIAAFKKRGIYVDINLHVGRTWDERDGFPAKEQRPWADKALDNFEPRMIELQREYARKLLTHVNPYTGHAYADEPCVAAVEINNENALFMGYHTGSIARLPEPYAGEFRRQWNAWLRAKYASTAAMLAAWQWTPAPLGNEQIPEGRFDRPITLDGRRWILARGTAEISAQVQQGVLRIVVTRDGNEFFPKLFRTLAVKKDQPYTLSFKIRRAQGGGTTEIGMAVADTQGGWRSLGLFQPIDVGSAWKSVRYSFLAADDAPAARLYLTRFKQGVYEIDNLSFQSGAESVLNAAMRLEDGTVPPLSTSSFAPRQATHDFYQFLYDTEHRYWLGMYQYLKRELKVKPLVSGTQVGYYSPAQIQAQLDYVDAHSYWRHPSGKDLLHDRRNWRIANDSMVNSLGCIQGLAGMRVLGKAYTVSEYNHPFPNLYGAEGQPMLRAYGRFQGWDGVFQYSYNHYPDQFEPTAQPWCYFDMIARTDVLAHFPACAAMFLRGDVQEGRTTVVGALDPAEAFDRMTRTRSVANSIAQVGFDSRLTLLHKTAFDVSGKLGTPPASVAKISSDQKVFVSDTGELTWNLEQPGAGYWTVNTPHTKLFTGFPQGRTIPLGPLSLTIGRTRLDWATVSLVSRQATGFGESGRPANILLAATGLAQNKGMVIERLSDRDITLRDWGQGPMLVEGIPLTLTLPVKPARVHCFALDPHGDRKREVPLASTAQGTQLVLKPEYETVWYEICIK